MKRRAKLLVIGAGGFIGGRIVEILARRNEGFDVVAGIHSWSNAARIGRFPIKIVKCDLLDKSSISLSLEKISYVVNCAAGSDKVFIDGTKNLLEVVREKRIRKIVHLSSVAVYGKLEGRIVENSDCSASDGYGMVKLKGENLCRKFSDSYGMPISILRPGIVYGPFGQRWTAEIANQLCSGSIGISKINNGICNLLYVDDLVLAIILCMRSYRSTGEIFNITGGEELTWNKYFSIFSRAIGCKVLTLNAVKEFELITKCLLLEPLRIYAQRRRHRDVQLGKLTPRGDLTKYAIKVIKRSVNSTPRLSDLEIFRRMAIYDCNKARSLLKFKPHYTANHGVKLSGLWLKHQSMETW